MWAERWDTVAVMHACEILPRPAVTLDAELAVGPEFSDQPRAPVLTGKTATHQRIPPVPAR